MRTFLFLGLLVAFVLISGTTGDELADSSQIESALGDNAEEFAKFQQKFGVQVAKSDLKAVSKAFDANLERLKALQEKYKGRKFKINMGPYMAIEPQALRKKVLLPAETRKQKLFPGMINRQEAKRLRKEKREKKKAARAAARAARKQARLEKKAQRQKARADKKAARKGLRGKREIRQKRGLFQKLKDRKAAQQAAAAAAVEATAAPAEETTEAAADGEATAAEETGGDEPATDGESDVEEQEDKEPAYDPQIDDKLPEKFDWRDYGVITPVKNQGECGSCWTFSAVGVLEAQHARKHPGELLDLSEQQSTCTKRAAEVGTICEGGWPSEIFETFKNNSLGLESSDPYAPEGDMSCKRKTDTPKVRVSALIDLSGATTDEIKDALIQDGPMSIYATVPEVFSDYGGGLFDEGCDNMTQKEKDESGHVMVLIGFGKDEDGDEYWIIKNSYGPEWGEKGFIKWKTGLCALEKILTQAKITDTPPTS